jgi:hypothetical protein
VLDREAAAYWIARWSLSSGGALRRPGGAMTNENAAFKEIHGFNLQRAQT